MPGRRKVAPEIKRVQRDLGQVHDRKCFEESGNVFYPLSTILRYRGEELPSWVRQWLDDFAKEVLPAYLERPGTLPLG